MSNIHEMTVNNECVLVGHVNSFYKSIKKKEKTNILKKSYKTLK